MAGLFKDQLVPPKAKHRPAFLTSAGAPRSRLDFRGHLADGHSVQLMNVEAVGLPFGGCCYSQRRKMAAQGQFVPGRKVRLRNGAPSKQSVAIHALARGRDRHPYAALQARQRA